jgi:hypothetical protein
MRRPSELRSDRAAGASLIALVAGVAAFLTGTAFGWNGGILDAIVRPPALVRAALVGASVVVALALLGAALRMLRGHDPASSTNSLPLMVRGIRLSFLALAAVAAAAGWALGHPLPLIIALLIAAVDVIETSFLLLVVTFRSQRD